MATIQNVNNGDSGLVARNKINSNANALNTIPDGQILVGNASNISTAVPVTGDITIDNTGLTTIGTGKVTSDKIASSVALTGVPTAPTAITGTNTTQIATTAFVANATSSASNNLISSATKNADFVAFPNNQYNVDSSSTVIVVTVLTPPETKDGALLMFVDVGGNAFTNEIQITNGVDLLGNIRTNNGMILFIYNQTQNKWVIQNQGGYNIDGSNNFNIANIYRFNPSVLVYNFTDAANSFQLYNNSQQNILITSSTFVSSRYLILPTGSGLPTGFYFSIIDVSLGRLFPILTGSSLNPANSLLPNQNSIDKTTLITIIWNGSNWVITTNREFSANGLASPTTFNLTQSDKRTQIFAVDTTPAQTVNLPSASSFVNGDNFILQNFTTVNTITVNYGAGSPATLAPNFSAIFYVKNNSWIMQPFNTYSISQIIIESKDISNNYSILNSDTFIHVDATAGSVVLTLPDTATSPLATTKTWTITREDATNNSITIQTQGSDVILGGTTGTTFDIPTTQFSAINLYTSYNGKYRLN